MKWVKVFIDGQRLIIPNSQSKKRFCYYDKFKWYYSL